MSREFEPIPKEEELPPALKMVIVMFGTGLVITLLTNAICNSDGYQGPPGYRQEYHIEKSLQGR